jgi:hypothetical protein
MHKHRYKQDIRVITRCSIVVLSRSFHLKFGLYNEVIHDYVSWNESSVVDRYLSVKVYLNSDLGYKRGRTKWDCIQVNDES